VYADVNAFGEIFASSGSRVQVSGEASQEMSAWLRDTLTLAGSTGIPESAGIISRGIALAA